MNTQALASWMAVATVALGFPLFCIMTPIVVFWRAAWYPFSTWGFLAVAFISWGLYDLRTPGKGGRPLPAFCRTLSRAVSVWDDRKQAYLPFWDLFRSYFPATRDTIASHAFPPGVPYLLLVHPHGIWGCGIWCNLFLGTASPGSHSGMPEVLANPDPNRKPNRKPNPVLDLDANPNYVTPTPT